MDGFLRKKSAKEIIRFFESLRKLYRGYRLYIILDCWRAHRSKALKAYVKGRPITLVELPTNCSWLNPVERVFADIQRQVLANSEYWPYCSDSVQTVPLILPNTIHGCKKKGSLMPACPVCQREKASAGVAVSSPAMNSAKSGLGSLVHLRPLSSC